MNELGHKQKGREGIGRVGQRHPIEQVNALLERLVALLVKAVAPGAGPAISDRILSLWPRT